MTGYEIEWSRNTTKRDSKGNAWVTHRIILDMPINRIRQYIMNDSAFRNVTGAITVRQIKADGKKTVGDMMRWKGVWEWRSFPSHANHVVAKDGSIGPILNKNVASKKAVKKKPAKKDFTKYTAMGLPVYKIWYNGIMDSYDCLARQKNGEWVYGRDYDLKDGIWQGGRYDYDLDNLYRRVGGTFGKVVVNNKRGPTGKF